MMDGEGGAPLDPRHYCATCEHIRHVTEADRTYYFCSRLGWTTLPRWRFQCWSPRPLGTPMPRLTRTGGS